MAVLTLLLQLRHTAPCYTLNVLRLAGIAMFSGAVAEGMLFACLRFGGPIGPCGPTSAASFAGLVGHIPALVIQALLSCDFPSASVFAVNGLALAVIFFFVGRRAIPLDSGLT